MKTKEESIVWEPRAGYKHQSTIDFTPFIPVEIVQRIYVSRSQKPRTYVNTFWRINPNTTAGHVIKALAQFYEELKKGAKPAEIKGGECIMPRITLTLPNYTLPASAYEKKIGELTLDQLIARLNIDPTTKRFCALRINTRYADFGLTTTKCEKPIWIPEEGLIVVDSTRDISEPLAELIYRTIPDKRKILPSEIAPVLKRAYEHR